MALLLSGTQEDYGFRSTKDRGLRTGLQDGLVTVEAVDISKGSGRGKGSRERMHFRGSSTGSQVNQTDLLLRHSEGTGWDLLNE